MQALSLKNSYAGPGELFRVAVYAYANFIVSGQQAEVTCTSEDDTAAVNMLDSFHDQEFRDPTVKMIAEGAEVC
jgi:hypothetical protein